MSVTPVQTRLGRKPDARPYPVRPLLDAAGVASCAEFGRLVGVDPARLQHNAARGLTDLLADRLAVAAGLHPGSVWPEWFAPENVEYDCRPRLV